MNSNKIDKTKLLDRTLKRDSFAVGIDPLLSHFDRNVKGERQRFTEVITYHFESSLNDKKLTEMTGNDIK